jgi:signal transduction histidine kinase
MNSKQRNTITLQLILVYLTGMCFIAQGQSVTKRVSANQIIKHYTDQNGLPQNSVKGISHGDEGFIWLATESGLVRFDGNYFFSHNNAVFPAISNRIRSIYPSLKTAGGTMFSETEAGEYLQISNGRAHLDTVNYKTDIASARLIDMDPAQTAVATGAPHIFPEVFTAKNYMIPVTGSEGSFFVLNDGKLDFYFKKKKKDSIPYKGKDFSRLFRINQALFQAEKDGTFRKIYSPDEKSVSGFSAFQLLGDIQKDPAYHASPQKATLYWNNVGNQAFVSFQGSFYILSQTRSGRLTTTRLLADFDFEHNYITSAYYDEKRQRTFLGSQIKGLFVISKKHFEVLTTGYGDSDNVFYAQNLYDSNSIFTPQGIILGKPLTPGAPMIEKRIAETGNVKVDNQYSLQLDSTGMAWVAESKSLYRISKSTGQQDLVWVAPTRITQLFIGRNNRLWIGTLGAGLYSMNAYTIHVKPVRCQDAALSNLHINYLLEDGKDGLWIAADKGVYKMSISTGKSRLIEGTGQFFARALHIGSENELWIASYNNGLALYRDAKITRFPPDKNGYLSTAHCIVEDRKGFLWITTNKGLFQILKQDLLNYAGPGSGQDPFYMYYSAEDGFNTNEFNGGCQPCAFRLPNGYVSLPSLNGLVWFIPERIVPELPDQKIFIETVGIDGEGGLFSDSSVVIKRGNKELKFYVRTPYFGLSDNLHFSYALIKGKGLPAPDDWLALDSQQAVINISHLSNGNYTLYLRKANGFGSGNYTYDTVSISVPPYWYETYIFYFFCLFWLGLGIYLYLKIRLQKIVKQNALLESKIRYRTKDLQAAMYVLEDAKIQLDNQLHLQSHLIASIAHDVTSPLNYIRIIIGQIGKLILEKEYQEAHNMATAASEAVGDIQVLLGDLLAYTKAQTYRKEVKREMIYLHGMVEGNFKLYGKTNQASNNQLINEVAGDLTVNTSPQLLDIVLHNIVDNANKYLTNGIIRAYVTLENGRTHLHIEDSGHGMPKQLIDWLNQKGNSTPPAGYKGLGLILIKEMTAIMGIETIYKKLEHGTVVTLIF